MSTPLDTATRDEATLRGLIARVILRLRRELPIASIESGSYASTAVWRAAVAELRSAHERLAGRAGRRAYAEALAVVRQRLSRPVIAEAVGAPLAARQFAEGLSGSLARGFNAALQAVGFEVQPTAVRALLGPTRKQVARIAGWAALRRVEGWAETEIIKGMARQGQAAIRLRARATAERAMAEAVNGARARAWQAQIDAGTLPADTRKRWRTQGDRNVRPTHRKQAAAGPIPWNEPYAVFGVMHPPAPDPGCRCFEEPVMPRGRRAQPAVPPPRVLVGAG